MSTLAVNELRSGFAGRSIYTSAEDAKLNNNKVKNGKFRLESGFLGAHSDIGGGYAEGDLSDIALYWMFKHAGETGLKLEIPGEYSVISEPTVHDSVGVLPLTAYDPTREFQWSTQNTHGDFQTKTQSHLLLNYLDTGRFENLKYSKIKNKNAPTSKFSLMLDSTKKTFYDNPKYMSLKTKDAEGNNTILYDSKDKTEVIQIQKYLDWLKKNYQLNLTTK